MEVLDLRFQAKNVGAIVRRCQFGAVLRALFEYFGPFCRKNDSFSSIIGRNRTVFEHFEKGTVVFALTCTGGAFAPKNKDLGLEISHELHENSRIY